jgi:Domain of unknown function (DUF5615)
MLKYLMDENVNPVYINQLRRQKPDLVIWAVGEPDTPPKGTLDPEILIWCEVHNFVLITNNRTSMPVHLVEHLSQNHHVPGVFILNSDMTIGETIDELILLAEYSFEEEYQDQIIHLPIPRTR